MNDLLVIGLELLIVGAGLAVLLADLWLPAVQKPHLGYAAAVVAVVVFLFSFAVFLPEATGAQTAFGGMFVQDELALFFKRLFLLGAALVLVMSVESASGLDAGAAEYYALILFATAGLMLAASANDFSLLFVAVELVTITFYILAGFQRRKRSSLEAGVKYLVLGGLSSAILIYGIALVFGATGSLSFSALARAPAYVLERPLLALGLLLVFAGLSFKVAAAPFQFWAPDVYQGAPTPTTAFLAVGSKAAGFVLLLRVLFVAAPAVTVRWSKLLMVVAAATILYGNLCAVPQRSLKRMLAYSSIAHAGYLLLGIAALSAAGAAAVLYYLAGYLFTVIAAFTVVCLAASAGEADDLGTLAGLHRRSPLLAAAMTLAMVSLAGVPPLAGFFGKFLLLKAALARASAQPGMYALLAIALVGIVISLYYYFGVVRAIFWAKEPADLASIPLSGPIRWSLYACMAGMLWLGVFPNSLLNLAQYAVRSLRL